MILNQQRRVAVSLPALERFWRRVRRLLRFPREAATICLVPEARISRWNLAYRGKRGPTDVLSFPAEAGPERLARSGAGRGLSGHGARNGRSLPGYLGDIAIAPGVARRNARRLGRSVQEELRILILHGALHLAGYDHEADSGEMDRLEQRLRRRLGLAQR